MQICSLPGVAMGSHSRVHESDANTASVMRLVEISAGYWLSRALHVVADLGVADSLDEETRSAEYLAEKAGANPDALDRFAWHLSEARRQVRSQCPLARVAQRQSTFHAGIRAASGTACFLE